MTMQAKEITPVQQAQEKPVTPVQEVQQLAIPPKPKGAGRAIAKYYRDNSKRIEQDYNDIGADATCKKWGIQRLSTWNRFRAMWGLPSDPPKRKPTPKPVPSVPSPEGDYAFIGGQKIPMTLGDLDMALEAKSRAEHKVEELPNLPGWNEAWGDAVKVKWLEIVGNLMAVK